MRVIQFNENEIDNPEMLHVLRQIDDHCVETVSKLDKIERTVTAISGAFPQADFEGHKRYHQTMIDILNEKRALRVAIREKTIAGLVWAGIVLVSVSIWHEVVDATRRTPPREEIRHE